MEIVTRNVDKLGRIVLPMDFRRTLGLECGDTVMISIEDGAIVARGTKERCRLCGARCNSACCVTLCTDCIAKIKRL